MKGSGPQTHAIATRQQYGAEASPQRGCDLRPIAPMNPAYRTARFQCALGPGDIRHPRFAIVTACDPGDRVRSDEANRQADAGLLEDLDRHGWWRFRVIGGSPDFRHQEPGWGVATASLEQAIALGRRWGQAAVFWVEHDALSLVDCANGDAEALGSWSARTRFHQALGPWRVVPE